jgi:2-keto-4-pentenoate hydratase/2-oxohepta-3-ene-1,7-dioic acid hydratase in catechol pathway
VSGREEAKATQELEYPVLFARFAEALAAPGAPILLPHESAPVDDEAELALVIGETVRRAAKDRALAAVAGYAVANNVTMRDGASRVRRRQRRPETETFDHQSPGIRRLVCAW